MANPFERRRAATRCAAFIFATIAIPTQVYAQEVDDGATSSPSVATEAAEAQAFWTPERLGEATPPRLPTPGDAAEQGLPRGYGVITPQVTESARGGESEPGQPPSFDAGAAMERPIAYTEPFEDGGATTEATSSLGAHFTTTRVIPNETAQAYPYRTAGKLFFHDPKSNTDHVCSAAVVRPRLIATAGHCVTNPSTNPDERYFFTNFLFVPAFDNGVAPFGTWTSSQQWVSNNWYHSDGSVPNRGDMAMIVASDQTIGRASRRIGTLPSE